MEFDFFWKSWPAGNRLIYRCLLFLFLLTAALSLVAYYTGNAMAYGWEERNGIERVENTLGVMLEPPFEFQLQADNLAVFTTFLGEQLRPETWPGYILLAGIGVFLIFYFSMVSMVPRFWYFIFTAFGVIFLLTLKLEQLNLFGQSGNTAFLIALAIYLPLSYYFQAFSSNSSLATRLLFNTLVTALFAAIIYHYSDDPAAFVFMLNYGMFMPLLISMLFILFTSQEVIYFFLVVVTGSSNALGKNNALHFTLLSLFYIINVILTYMHYSGILNWDIYYLDPLWLLVFTSIVGIWGWKKKCEAMGTALPFYPAGALLYLVFGMTSFMTIAFFYITGNDALQTTIRDVIVYSHFGFGMIFFIYVIANFYTLIAANKKVYRVVYDPRRMPYITAILAGIIVVVALFFRSNKAPYYKSLSGLNTYIADAFTLNGDRNTAASYYELATIYSRLSHRPNYSLASEAAANRNWPRALYYFRQSTERNPTPQAFVNTAFLEDKIQSFFNGIFTLEQSTRELGEEGHVLNNLGMLYRNTDALDSTIYYLEKALEFRSTKNPSRANILGVLAKRDLVVQDTDSLLGLFRTTESAPLKSNLSLMLNLKGQPWASGFDVPDTTDTIDPVSIALLSNQLYNQRYDMDTAVATQIEALLESRNFGVMDDHLRQMLGLSLYYSGYVGRGIENLQLVSGDLFTQEGYAILLGQFFLMQDAPRLAAETLERAGFSQKAMLLKTLAYLDAGMIDEAKASVVELDSAGDFHTELKNILLNGGEALPDDLAKYLALRFNLVPESESLLEEVTNPSLKLFAAVHLYQKSGGSSEYADTVREIHPPDGNYFSHDHLWMELRELEKEGSWEVIRNTFANELPFKHYFLALADLAEGDRASAEDHMSWLKENPYFEPGVQLVMQQLREEQRFEDAYNYILTCVRANPYSIVCHQEYALAAIKLGLDTYAEDSMKELKELMEPDDFAVFRNRIEVEKQRAELEF